jgi:hypothetical protein
MSLIVAVLNSSGAAGFGSVLEHALPIQSRLAIRAQQRTLMSVPPVDDFKCL